jgi:hypothetical protein
MHRSVRHLKPPRRWRWIPAATNPSQRRGPAAQCRSPMGVALCEPDFQNILQFSVRALRSTTEREIQQRVRINPPGGGAGAPPARRPIRRSQPLAKAISRGSPLVSVPRLLLRWPAAREAGALLLPGPQTRRSAAQSAVWKPQGIMMCPGLMLVDLPAHAGSEVDRSYSTAKQSPSRLAFNLAGKRELRSRKNTPCCRGILRGANPRVPVLKCRVFSFSPTLAGRDFTLCKL